MLSSTGLPLLPPLPSLSTLQLALPQSVRFGWGVRAQLGEVARSLGRRVWLVVGSRTLQQSGEIEQLQHQLLQCGLEPSQLATITREPLVDDVDATVARLLSQNPGPGDVIVGIGGGAAIDLAKAVAAMATNRHGETVQDFLEGVGRGLRIEQAPLPVIAIPTTSGTGSEATRNSVISSNDPPFKKSLRSEQMLPRAVLLDPELTCTCPAAVTAASGMDAITQLIESLLSRRSNPFTAALCWAGLQVALPALPVAVRDPANREARTAMQYAAFLSGVALANSGLGLAHGVAAALGVHGNIPHGLACAVMLSSALRFNRAARPQELAMLGRLLQSSRTDSVTAPADDSSSSRGECQTRSEAEWAELAITGIEQLCREVGVPSSLRELGITPEQIEVLIPASSGNSLSGNPRDVSETDLREILNALC